MAEHSFQLSKPDCPHCHSEETHIHWRRLGNLWRVPAAGLAGLLFPNDLGPEVLLLCSDCQATFSARLPEHLNSDFPPRI